MVVIKAKPEDFLVREVAELDLSGGSHSVYELKKKGMTTDQALFGVRKAWRVKRIGYAGLKDRQAVTWQHISILNGRKADLKGDGFSLRYLGKSPQGIVLGGLIGNGFEIVVRDIDPSRVDQVEDVEQIPNYFDEQRFSERNVEVGRLLVAKEFAKAAALLAEGTGREELGVLRFLEAEPGNAIGALRTLDQKLLLLFVHSFQSLLFNECLGRLIRSKSSRFFLVPYSEGEFVFPEDSLSIGDIPLPGFSVSYSGEEGDMMKRVMSEQGVQERDFILKSLAGLSCEGSFRSGFVDVKDLSFGWDEDEMNNGRKKCLIRFNLGSGSYGTIVVKALFRKVLQDRQ
ncbi:hypothetical protein CMO92_04445 [Candidatus Woesearchaeota archaeon]|nr:hypothetical protein [Candidatus Woesearchaeota archaeon]|tara:strand:- start:146 stop:1174 length:1029 start_codon:yes stop_codon:yes gene_type:complete